MIRVLALDLATQTGVAFDDPDPEGGGRRRLQPIERPTFKTWQLAPSGHRRFGVRFAELYDRMIKLIDDLDYESKKPDVIAFEEPLLHKYRRGYGSGDNVRLLVGLAAVAEMVAEQHSIKCVEVNITTVKVHFGGKAGGDKEAIGARCRQLGWATKNADESDAASIWSFVKCSLDPKFSYQSTPLFGRQK